MHPSILLKSVSKKAPRGTSLIPKIFFEVARKKKNQNAVLTSAATRDRRNEKKTYIYGGPGVGYPEGSVDVHALATTP